MYKHILIPVTFDENCDVSAAAEVAQEVSNEDARITLLHALEPLPTDWEPYFPADLKEKGRATAYNRLEEMADKVPGSQGVVTYGSAGRAITTWAEDNGVDCIAISSHRPVLSDIFLGSTAAWVVRHAQCAVHVLR